MQKPPEDVLEVQAAAISEMVTGRRGRMRVYVFEFFTAVAFPILGAQYLLSPEAFAMRSAIGRTLYPFDYVWNVGYIAGGVLILLGLLWPRMSWRAVGHIVLGTALAMQCVAAFAVAPQLRDLFTGVYALACFSRAYLAVKLFQRYRLLPPIWGPGAP